MNPPWICSDIWLDILPLFDRVQLGLKMGLLSIRFDVLVDKYFGGKSELTIWRPITVHKDIDAEAPQLFVNDSVAFPLPERPLPTKIRFQYMEILYIDHSVLAFLHANKQIFDKGTNLNFKLSSFLCGTAAVEPIWDLLAHEIWPIFATNIRRLGFYNGDHLDNLLRRISATMLTDLNQQMNQIDSGELFPTGSADDGPNATAGQVLSKWLHTPITDGQPKQLHCSDHCSGMKLDWISTFKEEFLRATTPASYNIQLHLCIMPQKPFELVNERTQERLKLEKIDGNVLISYWLLNRWPIAGETAAVQRNYQNSNKLNNVRFCIRSANCVGQLSPQTADQRKR